MEWLLLVICQILYVLGCWLTFGNEVKDRWWYVPCGALLGVLTNICWYVAAQMVTSKEDMYFLSVIWEGLLIAIYFLMPVLFMGVRLDKYGIIGLCLMAAGAILLKVRT